MTFDSLHGYFVKGKRQTKGQMEAKMRILEYEKKYELVTKTLKQISIEIFRYIVKKLLKNVLFFPFFNVGY